MRYNIKPDNKNPKGIGVKLHDDTSMPDIEAKQANLPVKVVLRGIPKKSDRLKQLQRMSANRGLTKNK